jgi:hypothetical protein
MIRIGCEQGSAEWFDARRGVPTASRFDEILAPKTLKLSNSCTRYAHELIASEILGYDVNMASSGFMTRGVELEEQAVSYYELHHDIDTEKVGFILRDDRRVGCSPDRLVGDNGLLEIKCPSAAVHIGYLLNESIGYRLQVQGQLWIAEREWCDTLSYNPELPSAIVREERDETVIKKLAEAMEQFINYVGDLKAKLVYRGYFPELAVPALTLVGAEG